MTRPSVVPTITRRSRHQPTLNIWVPPPKATELDADFMRVQAQLARRPAAKVSAANVDPKRAEVPQVPRAPCVARQSRRHAPTLESKESAHKGKCHNPAVSPPSIVASCSLTIATQHMVPARSKKSNAVQRYSQGVRRPGDASLRVPWTLLSLFVSSSHRRLLILSCSDCRACGS